MTHIALVGGGKACVELLNTFIELEGVRVIGVADLRSDAPGVLRATELSIRVYRDMEELVGLPEVDQIIELTGSGGVRARIRELLRPNQEFMSSGSALLMVQLAQAGADRKKAAGEHVNERFHVLRGDLEQAIDGIERAFNEVRDVLKETSILTLNARIEATRAGQAGVAFGVVVERMQELMRSTRGAVERISRASKVAANTLDAIAETEQELELIFRG